MFIMNLSDLKTSSLGLIGGFEYTSSGSLHSNNKGSSKACFDPEVEQHIFSNTFGGKSVNKIFNNSKFHNDEKKSKNTRRNGKSKEAKRKTSKRL